MKFLIYFVAVLILIVKVSSLEYYGCSLGNYSGSMAWNYLLFLIMIVLTFVGQLAKYSMQQNRGSLETYTPL